MGSSRRLLCRALLLSIVGASGSASAEPSPQPPSPEADRRPLVVAEGEAFVHVDAEPAVGLRQLRGRFGRTWCNAPCDRTISFARGGRFELTGTPGGLGTFELEQGQRNTVRVEGDWGVHWLGLVSLSVGAGALGAGALGLALSGVGHSLAEEDLPKEQAYLFGGLIGGGAALLALGWPLMVAFQPKVRVDQLPVAIGPRALTVRF